MEERQTLRQATNLWQEAHRYQMEGELDCAIDEPGASGLLQRELYREDGGEG